MSAPTPDTEQAFATLDKMFDADVLRHLVAISEDGKVTARSFKHANRAAMCEWIDDRQGKSNLYFTVNELGLEGQEFERRRRRTSAARCTSTSMSTTRVHWIASENIYLNQP